MSRAERNKGIVKIIQHYGAMNQVDIAIEEMAELTKALLKFRRDSSDNNLNNIIEELGDVTLMMVQLAIIYDCGDDVEHVIEDKIYRQLERIKKEKERA